MSVTFSQHVNWFLRRGFWRRRGRMWNWWTDTKKAASHLTMYALIREKSTSIKIIKISKCFQLFNHLISILALLCVGALPWKKVSFSRIHWTAEFQFWRKTKSASLRRFKADTLLSQSTSLVLIWAGEDTLSFFKCIHATVRGFGKGNCATEWENFFWSNWCVLCPISSSWL